jgi:acid phosphatase
MSRQFPTAGRCLALRVAALTIAVLAGVLPRAGVAALPAYDHVVIAIEENRAYSEIIGSPSAPYINSLAAQGALFTSSYAIQHPSEPNYLELFSGSNQGVNDDDTYTPPAFTTPNLGAALLAKGYTFGGYSESLPSVGFTDSSYTTVPGQNQYVLKHNPWVNWQDAPTNGIPAAANMPFTSFPGNYASLPTVSFVVPNEQNDMHDGSISQADTWLNTNLSGYATWAMTHNSLLVVTWDEDDGNGDNRIATIFAGADVTTGQFSETINHYNVLRTVEDMYGLPYAGASADAAPISDVFTVPEPSTFVLAAAGLAALSGLAGRKRRASCSGRFRGHNTKLLTA